MRSLAAEVLAGYPRLDLLFNNAGAMYGIRQLTKDGLELTWAVNHLAPFLLITLLLDRLNASAPACIITTASDAHRGASIPFDDLNAERSYRGFELNRWPVGRLCASCFDTEAERAKVRFSFVLVTGQRELIDKLERDGHDTVQAGQALEQFEDLQRLHVADCARLEKGLAEISN